MKIESLLKCVIYIGIFAVLFVLPFIVSSSLFFPFITGKNFAFRIIVGIMFGAWAILALYNKEYRLKFSLLPISLAVFVGIIALADIFGVNPSKSIWSNFERMDGLVTLVHLLAYFVVVGTVINTEKLWNRFFHISIGASVFVGLYGFLQLAGKAVINQGGVRLDAKFGNSSYLAVYMMFHIFLTLFFLLRHKGVTLTKWVYGAVILLQSIILYYTATRGAILGLLGGLILTALLIVIFEKNRVSLKKVFAGILVSIVVLTGLFIGIKNTSFVQDSPVLSRFSSISLNETTTKSRFMIWDMAWQGVKERPILGWGQENFSYVFNKYYDPKMYEQEQWFDRTHNIIFDWLIAGGFLGLISYLAIFGCTLYCLWLKKNNFSISDRSVITGLLAGYFFQNLFVFDNLFSYIMFFSVLAFIYSNTSGIDTTDTKDKKIDNNSSTKIIVALMIIIITLASVYLVNYKGFMSGHSLLQALSKQEGGLLKNIEYYNKALSYNSFGNQEICEQLVQAAIQSTNLDISLDNKKSFVSLASEEMLKQTERDPNNARLEVFLGSFMGKLGGYDASLTHLEKALALSPNKQSIYFEIVSVYLNKGDRVKALEYARKAYELEPKYDKAREVYAVVAIYAGENKLAEELLGSVHDGNINNYSDSITKAYFSNGQHRKVVEILERRVREDSQNPQNLLSLAAAYLQVGRTTDAINEIKKVIQLIPEFEAQGNEYIKQIKTGQKVK